MTEQTANELDLYPREVAQIKTGERRVIEHLLSPVMQAAKNKRVRGETAASLRAGGKGCAPRRIMYSTCC